MIICVNELMTRFRGMVRCVDKSFVADGLAYNRNWRLAELEEQGKPPVEAAEGLVLNFTLLSADPILQTTIHLQPLTGLAVVFAGDFGYRQTVCGGLLHRSTSRTARRVFS